MFNKILILISTLLALSSYASAFFFSWGSPEQSTPTTRYFYHKRLLQGPSYAIVDPDKRPLPSVPIQVPLQAQFTPIPNVHNVQLVPCLCPVSPDNPYDNQVPYENFYVGPNAQIPQQVPQQNIVPHQQKK